MCASPPQWSAVPVNPAISLSCNTVKHPRLLIQAHVAVDPGPMAPHFHAEGETHTHADHVSGHGRLASATGATIHIHREAGAEYEHEPFDDGWELELGRVRVRVLHTPGHRPEHCAFLLVDSEGNGQGTHVCPGAFCIF